MRFLLIIWVSILSIFSLKAQPRFVSPIAGTYGKEYIIVNYVDWGASTTYYDHYCNTKTYDGHQGTDFVIRDFAAMDSGIDVRAADNGRVIFVQDGVFDREKTSVISKMLGNYVGIAHSGKLQTYYAHLRKGSIVVKKGDSVIAGQKLGLVGSSGNSESPHLHFELWYDSTINIDPFSGPCGNASSYWFSEPTFDTSFGIWTKGMVNFIPNLDTLKEGLKSRDTFYATDPFISFWNLQYGLRNNDSVRIDWINPSGVQWFSYGYKVSRDWWYYYFSSYINTPITGEQGKWTVKYYRNNVLSDTHNFYYYNSPSSIVESIANTACLWDIVDAGDAIRIRSDNFVGLFKIYNLQGQVLRIVSSDQQEILLSKSELGNGLYIVERCEAGKFNSRKKVIIMQ